MLERLFYWTVALAMLFVGLGCILLAWLGISSGSVFQTVVGGLGVLATVQTLKFSIEGLRNLAARTRRSIDRNETM